MSLKGISTEAQLAPSTTHRLLTTLQTERFVRFDADTSLWRVGVGAFTVGSAYLRYRDVVSLSRPYLRRLMETSGETASVYVADDGHAICMAQIESREMMRSITRIGGRVSLEKSGAGRAILAGLTSTAPNGRAPEHAALSGAELSEIINSGYAVDDQLNVEGVRCVGSAVFDESGYPVAALSISGPSMRIDRAALPRLGELVREAAASVTAEMGGMLRAAE